MFCASKRTPHVRLWEGGEIRILIADDSEAFRRAVKDLLNENSGESVVCGEATNGEDAVMEVAELLPDVILLDLSIPLLHGLRVAKILKRDYPALAVIVMSEQDISVLSRMADAAGTRYCISKARAGLELIPCFYLCGETPENNPISGRTKRTARANHDHEKSFHRRA